MRTILQLIFFTLLSIITLEANSQINFHWDARYNGTSSSVDEAKALVTDDSGYIYVTGYSYNTGSFEDYTTIKYSPGGNQLWAAVYNGPGNGYDQSIAIAVDRSGNVYVAGYVSGSGSSYDYATVKYNSNGVQQWAAVYNGLGNSIDYAASIAVDDTGNVYVTGQSYGGSVTSYDYVTIKYNTAGAQQWIARFNGTANGNDGATSIYVDSTGNIYVTGQSFESAAASVNYATVKYNPSGIQQWVSKYNGPGNGIDGANTVKADKVGNVFVTGFSRGSGTLYDYATVKYDSLGIQKWAMRHNGSANGNDGASDMVLDDSGNVYVTGYSGISGITNDYVTIKYDSIGVRKWIGVYNGPANQNDSATSIDIDDQGNICVTGYSTGAATLRDIATIKYNTAGVQEWAIRYDGGNGNDVGYSVKFDRIGDVYVTGKSSGNGTFDDLITLKYSKTSGINTISTPIDNGFKLFDNYPNPFNPSTKISFNLPKASFVNLSVFDVTGKQIETLVNAKLSEGLYEVNFNSSGLSSMLYFYKLWASTPSGEAGDFTQTKKMIFIK
ncbi:MAG: SBBP repeat-containing protein [Ignavibacteria bacterium]